MQDAYGISVLTRDPLLPKFRIPADGALEANFSPDSSAVVFMTEGLRVEKWDIKEQKQISAHELLMRRHCWHTALSPDGSTFACYDTKTDLHVIDVASGNSIFEKKEFFTPNWFGIFLLMSSGRYNPDLPIHFLNLRFSPDGRIVVAAAPKQFLALDLATRKAVSVAGHLRDTLPGQFAFINPEEVVLVDGDSSGIYRFPSGELVKNLSLQRQELAPATHGSFLMLRPIDKYPVGILDTTTNKIVMANRKSAADAYDDVLASEARDGEVALSKVTQGTATPFASITLPRAQISRPRAVDVSDDLEWIAYSDTDRGIVFNLKSNERVMFTRGFRGAFISGGSVYADFPKQDKTPRTIARMDLAKRETEPAKTLDEDDYARQMGQYLILKKPAKRGGSTVKDVSLEVQDAVTGRTLWRKPIAGITPTGFMELRSGILVLARGISQSESESDKRNNELPLRFDLADEKKSVYDLELLDANTGNKLGNVHIDSGKLSFSIRNIAASRDYVAVSDSENRVLLYSVSSGREIGTVFGGPAVLSPTGRMAVVTQAGKIAIYNCATLAKTAEYEFPSRAIFSHLSSDGNQLLVLTADQIVYILDASKKAQDDLTAHSGK